MAHLHRSRACFRIFGDDLIPDEISAVLGCSPTNANAKGDIVRYESGRERIFKTGSWRLDAADQEPENLDCQVDWLLSQLPNDFEIWRELTGKFQVDLFCGLFMNSSNEGVSLSSKTLLALGTRGIKIDLDIYDAGDDEENEVPNVKP